MYAAYTFPPANSPVQRFHPALLVIFLLKLNECLPCFPACSIIFVDIKFTRLLRLQSVLLCMDDMLATARIESATVTIIPGRPQNLPIALNPYSCIFDRILNAVLFS